MQTNNIARQQTEAYLNAYDYFNQELFGGELPGCILNFSRHRGAHGFVKYNSWKKINEEGEECTIHELSLTPQTLSREPKLFYSTLVHEMAHIWQIEFGTPSRSGYHNKEWAKKMVDVGLIPSDTGEIGGKQTGQRMTHYIDEEGHYLRVFNQMPQEYILPFIAGDGFLTAKPASKKRNKIRYECPATGFKVWGKPGLNIVCGDTGEQFIEQD